MDRITSLEKAKILNESLPYIRRFQGSTFVIKYGGNAMINDELKKAVISDITLLKLVGIRPVVIHGGGPAINNMLKKLEIKSEFIGGMRITDEKIMEVVEMVLVGQVSSDIINNFNHAGAKAIGLSGKDAKLLRGEKIYGKVKDENGVLQQVDIGFVGKVTEINTKLINDLLDSGYIPVISPVAVDDDGNSLNVNADLVAAKVAESLQCEKLVLLTDVEGVFRNYEDKESLISRVNAADARKLIEDEIITGGMIPKLNCCIDAISSGVGATHILDGRVLHCLLLEIFTADGVGTMVTK